MRVKISTFLRLTLCLVLYGLSTLAHGSISPRSRNLIALTYSPSKAIKTASATWRVKGVLFQDASVYSAPRDNVPMKHKLGFFPQQPRIGTRTVLFGSSEKLKEVENDRALGVLVLLTVPLAWGTYAPVVRYVYEMDPPVPGFLFSAGYYIVATLSLLVLNMMMLIDDEAAPVPNEESFSATNDSSDREVGGWNVPLPIQGGIELGGYLFLGNCLQVIGLKTVPADKAAFLVQLTTIIVPVLEAALKKDLRAISRNTWLACIFAFFGVMVMGYDGKELSGGDVFGLPALFSFIGSFASGDLLILLAAFAYSLHVVRLGRYAQNTDPLRLAASKATTEAIFSIALVMLLLYFGYDGSGHTPRFLSEMGSEIASYILTFGSALAAGNLRSDTLLPAAGAIIWTGLFTCAYTIYAQSYGQRRVSPTDANLIYTMQPVFSAIFAWALLGETLGPAGYLGGSLIGGALALISISEENAGDDRKTKTMEAVLMQQITKGRLDESSNLSSKVKDTRSEIISSR